MPLLPALTVVFVGVTGPNAQPVEAQLGALLRDEAHVEASKLSPAAVHRLAARAPGSREFVREMTVAGAIGGEIVVEKGHRKLAVVTYDAEGTVKSFVETPLSGATLSAIDIDVLRSNLVDDAVALERTWKKSHREPAKPESPKVEPPKAVVPEAPKVMKASKAEPAKPIAPTGDDEDPLARAAKKKKIEVAPSPEPVKAPPAPPVVEAASVSETVTADEIMAATSSDAVTPDEIMAAAAGNSVTAVATATDELHVEVSAGVGIAGRNFAPGPSTVRGYGSNGVGVVRLEGAVRPSARVALGVAADRALGMTTPMSGGAADTTMSRWEATASYTLVRGPLEIAPFVGAGRRAFAIASIDPTRSPDGTYNYAVAGARLARAFGRRAGVVAHAAFEPVVSGAQPTEMAFGAATRWALDVGVAVDVHATDHVFARASADFQRFAWSWDGAGARGAGGAVDAYPSAALSLGFDY